MSKAMRLGYISLLVGCVVLGIKVLAWALTGSVAMLSDAVETIVNIAAAIAALVAIRVADAPADASHPFGHHKAEYLSAVLEGALIVVAALFILWSAFERLWLPQPVDLPLLGVILLGVATALNALWARVLIQQGRALRSPALVSDGEHLRADVVTTIGVAAGVVLAWATGWWLLDPLVAICVALHILWVGWRVMTVSVGGLMDEAVPKDVLHQIEGTIRAQSQGAVEAHDLKTRNAGRAIFIEFHLVVPAKMTVFDAHAICDRIEQVLLDEIEGSQVTIHIEPDDKAKHVGAEVLRID